MSFPRGINGIIIEYLFDYEGINSWVEIKELENFEWFYNSIHPGREWYLDNGIFNRICNCGTLEIAQFFQEKQQITSEEYKHIKGYVFDVLCINGKNDLLKWLQNLFPMTKSEFIYLEQENPIFECSCINGHLDVVVWLTNLFELSKETHETSQLFLEVCRKGYLDIAKWLDKKFGPSYLGGYTIDRLIQKCYTNDHLSVCKWLIERYCISRGMSSLKNNEYDLIMNST